MNYLIVLPSRKESAYMNSYFAYQNCEKIAFQTSAKLFSLVSTSVAWSIQKQSSWLRQEGVELKIIFNFFYSGRVYYKQCDSLFAFRSLRESRKWLRKAAWFLSFLDFHYRTLCRPNGTVLCAGMTPQHNALSSTLQLWASEAGIIKIL